MKKIYKVALSLSIAVAALTACNVEKNNPIYTPNGNEVSFISATVYDTEIDAENATFDVIVTRTLADAALNVPVTCSVPSVVCPASVSFAPGEYQTKLALDISGLEVGKSYKGTLTLSDANTFNPDFGYSTANVTFAKAFTWVDEGNGEFYDGLALQPTDTDLGIIKVAVQKAKGFNRWRVYNPFPKANVIAAWDEDSWEGGESTVIEFWVDDEEEGTIKYDQVIKTGLQYNGMGSIYYYYPSAYSKNYAAYDAYNCFVDDNVVQFYVPQTIYGTNSWFGMGAKYLMLPGGPVTNLEAWLLAD